jgi:hypothetical protein
MNGRGTVASEACVYHHYWKSRNMQQNELIQFLTPHGEGRTVEIYRDRTILQKHNKGGKHAVTYRKALY